MDQSLRRRDLLAAAAALSAVPFDGVRAEAPARRFAFRTIEPAWIEVAGGVRLAARLWIPEGAPADRFPVVFEYIPYRTHDSYRFLDDRWGQQLASHGVAFARVDIRGSGNSEGVLEDEYLPIEQEDGVRIIAWLARQSWCNGAVGMRGLSWGGFSTLQVAALAPPELKAIMPMCATDMRFWNDAHYVGGAPGLTNLKWAAGFEMVMTGPPDPEIVGERWEAMWRRRLEATPSIAARWLEHQSNDAYWRHGSVGIDHGAIKCPVYIVDGWSDSYAESAERLLRGINTPKKALFGPWGHIYPDLARPGPGLDWAFEELRWWRHWLLGEETGVMQGPVFRFYMPYATPAETRMADLPGRWASEAEWPSPNIAARTLFLAEGALQTAPPAPAALTYRADQAVGLAKPEWIPYAIAELPTDQRQDDARSLVFDLPIEAPLEIVGVPLLTVEVSSDRPIAKLAARLCETTPDGASWLVTTGLLDLAFRNGPLAEPTLLTPGQIYRIDLPLAVIAHRFKAGSKLRLSLSVGLWPLVWPSPEVVTLKLHLGDARLVLPVRPIPAEEVPFPIPITHPAFSRGEPALKISDASGRITVEGAWPETSTAVAATGETLSGRGPDMSLSFDPRHPNRSRWTVSQASRFRRTGWDCETQVEIEMTSTARTFHVRERLTALKDGKIIFERRRTDAIPRRFS
jgi:putative CocE/NonD family hydrolase